MLNLKSDATVGRLQKQTKLVPYVVDRPRQQGRNLATKVYCANCPSGWHQ
jgi:hypothetical protein